MLQTAFNIHTVRHTTHGSCTAAYLEWSGSNPYAVQVAAAKNAAKNRPDATHQLLKP